MASESTERQIVKTYMDAANEALAGGKFNLDGSYPEYSAIYGSLMDDRHVSDYDMDTRVEPERAASDVESARKFVARIETYLRQEGWL